MDKLLKDVSETRSFSFTLADSVEAREKEAFVLGLYGDLGAGKTTFTQFFAEALGIKEALTSPTFVIMKKYPIENGKDFKTLVHIDAYRLDSSKELSSLGFKDEVSDRNNLIIVEWADKVEDVLPKETLKLYFEFIDDKTRKISYD